MTTLEYGKFVKNFVRTEDENGHIIKVPHSNWRGYSKKDIEEIIPKLDETYLHNWERYLIDLKNNEKLQAQYSDYRHFLFQLNSIPEEDIKKYDLPEDMIII